MKPILDSYKIEEIAKEFDLKLLVYFGSYQTEFYNKDSDIDIAMLSNRDLSTDMLINLLEKLIIFHRKSEIDLIDLKTAEPMLRFEVARNGRLLYEEKEGIYERYRLFYIKNFYELQPLIREDLKRINNSIREVLENDR